MAEKPLWDQRLATQAAVVDQMKKLGGVALEPHKTKAGFGAPEPPPKERD